MRVRTHLTTLLAAVFCIPSLALAQDEDFGANVGVDMGGANFGIKIDVKDGSRGKREVKAARREEMRGSRPGETFVIVYEETENGSTGFKVLEPEGFDIAYNSGGFDTRDTIPMSFSAQRGEFYRFVISRKGRVVFDKKLEAKAGMIGTLVVTVTDAPPPVQVVVSRPAPVPAPVAASCMDDGDLAAISGEIEGASFSEEKVGVLEEAMKHRSICGAQVIKVLDLYTFSADKLGALTLMAPKITDPANNFRIYGAFTFSGDKDQAKKILSR